MNKISGILPANSRVTTVDLKSGGSLRPGIPSFGRQVGTSALAQRKLERETTQVATDEFKKQMNLRNTEMDPKSKIVQKLADNFFNTRLENTKKEVAVTNPEDVDMVVEITPVEITDDTTEMDQLNLATDAKIPTPEKETAPKVALSATSKASPSEEDDDAPVVGRFLDVHV